MPPGFPLSKQRPQATLSCEWGRWEPTVSSSSVCCSELWGILNNTAAEHKLATAAEASPKSRNQFQPQMTTGGAGLNESLDQCLLWGPSRILKFLILKGIWVPFAFPSYANFRGYWSPAPLYKVYHHAWCGPGNGRAPDLLLSSPMERWESMVLGI